MYKSHGKYLILFPLFFFFTNCDRKTDTGFSQGRIEFDITYHQERVGNFSTSMLPQHMKMEYKSDITRNTIEGGLGLFRLVNVSDLSNYRNATYLKFIDKKFIHEGGKREIPCCFGGLEGMQLEFTDKTREIAGFHCEHAIARFPGDSIKPFDIWYTREIPLSHPNGNSPFREIPGVMLEFNTLLGDLAMHVRAKKYEDVHFQDREFELPKNYRPVTRDEMETILHALLD